MNPQHQEAQDAAQTMTDAIKLPELPKLLISEDTTLTIGPFTDDQMRAYARAAIQAARAGRGKVVAQFRKQRCSDWYDGHPDPSDGGGPYETRILYATPPDHTEALRLCREALRMADLLIADGEGYTEIAQDSPNAKKPHHPKAVGRSDQANLIKETRLLARELHGLVVGSLAPGEVNS